MTLAVARTMILFRRSLLRMLPWRRLLGTHFDISDFPRELAVHQRMALIAGVS